MDTPLQAFKDYLNQAMFSRWETEQIPYLGMSFEREEVVQVRKLNGPTPRIRKIVVARN